MCVRSLTLSGVLRSSGTRCAKDAVGAFAGAFCIGNECAQGATGTGAGFCCVGINCSNLGNGASCSDEANAGTPLNLGADSIYSIDCRRSTDTTSAAWLNFSEYCAQNYNLTLTITPYAPAGGCNVTCTAALSAYLRYYETRRAADEYGLLRKSYSIRWQNYASPSASASAPPPSPPSPPCTEENQGYVTATWVLVGVLGAGVLIFGVVQSGILAGVTAVGSQFQYDVITEMR